MLLAITTTCAPIVMTITFSKMATALLWKTVGLVSLPAGQPILMHVFVVRSIVKRAGMQRHAQNAAVQTIT